MTRKEVRADRPSHNKRLRGYFTFLGVCSPGRFCRVPGGCGPVRLSSTSIEIIWPREVTPSGSELGGFRLGSVTMAGDLASTNKSLRSRQTSNGDAKDKLPPAASPRLGATAWGTISAIQSESRSTVIPNGVKEGERSKLTYPPSSISDMSDRGLSSMRLELSTGISFQGYSFGASIPVSGELVFQTGMVGYPESMTDPSYRGQILVITFPLVGNYGVPSMLQKDAGLNDINSYFESKEIHIAGLVVSTYSNDFSHYLAAESLSSLLKRHNVPAVYGIDTRALTKLIRTQGSVLGRLHLEDQPVRWQDQNTKNLVKEGLSIGKLC